MCVCVCVRERERDRDLVRWSGTIRWRREFLRVCRYKAVEHLVLLPKAVESSAVAQSGIECLVLLPKAVECLVLLPKAVESSAVAQSGRV